VKADDEQNIFSELNPLEVLDFKPTVDAHSQSHQPGQMNYQLNHSA
jgi:hypothetical protein